MGTETADVAAIYREYYAMVWGQALRILANRSAAEDVAQDVFVRFLKFRQRGDVERQASAILFRMATNVALNKLRDEKRTVLGTDTETFTATSGSQEDVLALRKVLMRSRDEDGQIACYYYLSGMNQDEIAELLGLERREVGRKLERFRERAKRMLTSQEEAV